jgi:4-amino-4-deoxychorismate lyase
MTLINGTPRETLPVGDRGLAYGDGLFETVAVRDGRLLLWSEHLDRLRAGCARLGIPPPDRTALTREAESLCGQPGRAVLRITLTRGGGGRGYRPDPDAMPTRIVARHPWPDTPDDRRSDGVAVRLCNTRLAVQPALAGIKHLNRLEQVLARAEWDDPAVAEGLVLDMRGNVIEGTMSNMFLVHNGRLITPQLSECGVAGIMRARLIQGAESIGLPVEITQVSLERVRAAEEIFLTNSVIGIWPVRKIDDHDYSPGAICGRLAEALRDVIA